MDRLLLLEPIAGEDDELTFRMHSACFSFRKWWHGARHVEFPSVWVRVVESSLWRNDVSSLHGGEFQSQEADTAACRHGLTLPTSTGVVVMRH